MAHQERWCCGNVKTAEKNIQRRRQKSPMEKFGSLSISIIHHRREPQRLAPCGDLQFGIYYVQKQFIRHRAARDAVFSISLYCNPSSQLCSSTCESSRNPGSHSQLQLRLQPAWKFSWPVLLFCRLHVLAYKCTMPPAPCISHRHISLTRSPSKYCTPYYVAILGRGPRGTRTCRIFLVLARLE